MSDNTQQIIVDLLNQASIYGKDNLRVQHLRHVQELILRKDPQLLEHFLEEVLTFQTDKSVEIKKTVISFLEEACQIHPTIILRVIDNIQFLLHDDNRLVQKKLLLSLNSIHKSTFSWLINCQVTDENIDRMWQIFRAMKVHIVSELNSEHDGLCIAIVKFLEMLIITYAEYEQDSLAKENSILSRTELKREGQDMMDKLTAFLGDKRISNPTLIATIEALMNIIRYRSDLIGQVLQTFELLHAQLPSSLTDSQTENLRKLIKLKLFNLLKHSVSSDHHASLRTLLSQLDATPAEILKYSPKAPLESKRKFPPENCQSNTKKSKNIDAPVNNSHVHRSHSEDQCGNILLRKLTLANVVDLVLLSMRSLPDTMPLSFESSFIPISNAGSSRQIEHLAYLLRERLIADGCDLRKLEESAQLNSGENIQEKQPAVNNKTMVSIHPKKNKPSKFSNIIKPLDSNEVQRMTLASFHRILRSENPCARTHFTCTYKKILSSLVCSMEQSYSTLYKDFIFTDVHERYDLALTWIYQEYLHANKANHFPKYDQLSCQILEHFQEKDRELFARLFKDLPLITENALVILERLCQDENSYEFGLNILQYLISYRIVIRDKCLDRLLCLSENENHSIRNRAVDITKDLYSKGKCKESIEKYVCAFLNTLPSSESIQPCFSLYSALLPLNHHLIHPLTNVYTKVHAEVQRMLLKLVTLPIRDMGMANIEILKLMQSYPDGAETMMIHIISTLTEETSPSEEFIRSIKSLYYKRTSEIRLLIPILTHLQKDDIIHSLPKLIQLPPDVVKEVFHKLWISSISPSELLIAIHQISAEACDLKTLIHATSLCLNERSIYTDRILAQIIDELIEITPIPILFMRTVLQTLCLYPKLIQFIMNILQRLITKRAWEQSRIWEGFIRCCEKTRPYSFSLLLQLPPLQLRHILETTSELHDSLRRYICSMSTAQRSLISPSILAVIENN